MDTTEIVFWMMGGVVAAISYGFIMIIQLNKRGASTDAKLDVIVVQLENLAEDQQQIKESQKTIGQRLDTFLANELTELKKIVKYREE